MNPETPMNPTGVQPGAQPPVTPTTEPPKSNKNLLIVAVLAVVVIVGVLIFVMMNSNKDTTNSNTNPGSSSTNNSATTPDTSKYQKYDVTDTLTGKAFSVWFYKNAKVEEKNGRTYLNSGEMGSMYSVYLGVATGDKIDCGSTPSTTMKLGGESTTVCYDSDNTQYAGYAKTKDGSVKINLAGQKAISTEEAKTIMESVTF